MASTGKIKHYSAREEFLSAAFHYSGVILALIGGWGLYKSAAASGNGAFCFGMGFYFISLLAMFGASAVYHTVRAEKSKILCRKFDHCAIYLLITGTYAPILTGAVKSTGGNIVMTALIALTVIGIAGKFLFANRFHFLEVVIYLLMGWACVFIAKEMLASMSKDGLLLLLYGGLAYTGGVAFYVCRKEFCHAIWHLFVLAGAVFQYLAVLTIQP